MTWHRRLLDTLRTGRLDRELDEEMRFHLDMRAKQYERDGLAPDDARRAALKRFGSPLLARERVRDVRLLTWIDSVRQDAWLSLRLLRRSPGLAIAAVVSLGLGIGALCGVFALGDTLLLRTIPVASPRELLVPQWRSTEWPDIGIWGSNDSDNNSWSFSYPMYERFGRLPGMDVAGFQDLNGAVTFVRGVAGTADGTLVTGEFFGLLGLRPAAGRLIQPADNRPGAPAVVVISHRYWMTTFGGAASAVGSIMRVSGVDLTIVGVAPRSFFGMVPGRWADFYTPACLIPRLVSDFGRDGLTSDRFWWLQLVIRPRAGTRPEALQARLAAEFALMVKPHITAAKQYADFSLRSGAQGFAFQQEEAVKPILVLTGLVVVVLLAACSNVANLLLARAAARSREASMRLALGAGRLRLVRQYLTESLVIAALSGSAGLLAGRWFAAAVLTLAAGPSPLVLDLSLTWRDVAIAAGASVAAGLLVGLAPALALARSPVSSALRSGTTVRLGWRRRVGLGRPLVAIQVALSLLLLVVAGLFVRSLGNLNAVPLGFSPDGIVLFNLDPTAAGLEAERRAAVVERIGARLRQVPGVKAVAWSTLPLLGGANWMNRIQIVGEVEPQGQRNPSCFLLATSPAFHATFGIPLVAGRFFDERDGRTSPRVAIVNQAFIKQYLHGGPALGRLVHTNVENESSAFEIVGVVRDSKYSRIRGEFRPILFFADSQLRVPFGPTVALKTVGHQDGKLTAEIVALVHEIEPTLPVTRLRTFRQQIDQQLSVERSLSALSSAFGLVALLLAAVGLYGVVAFAVQRRTPEMGVRIALGAKRRDVLRLVMSDSLWVIVPGATVGVAAAAATTRFLESMLFGLKPWDPATIAGAVALLLGVAALAAFIPARRAASIDPVDALRCE